MTIMKPRAFIYWTRERAKENWRTREEAEKQAHRKIATYEGKKRW